MASGSITDRLRDTLALFETPGEPLTTPEVAERLDLGRRSTYERLERLVDQDLLATKKVGANARVWWRPPPTAVAEQTGWSAADAAVVADVFDDVDVGVFVVDPDAEVAWANAGAERYFGIDAERMVGQDTRALVAEHLAPAVEDAEAFAETVLSTDATAQAARFECHVLPGEGREERWLEHQSNPIDGGAYAGGRVDLYCDVTDRKRSELARQAESQEFASLVEAVGEYAIFTLDPDGYVRTWNPGVERIKGYAADEILGEHFSMFYTDEARAEGRPAQNLAAAAEQGSVKDEGWRVTAHGSQFWANVTLTAIRDDDGELQGFAKVTRDMTERRERERTLRRERDLTEQLFDIAPVRLGIFRADGSPERINAQARRDLGIDDTSPGTIDFGRLNLRNSDGDPIPPTEHPVPQALATGEPVSEQLVRHDAPDGTDRWVSITVAPLFDEAGQVERVVVAGKDVTALKRKECQLARQRDELADELNEVFERIDDAVYALDDRFRFTYANEMAERYLDAAEDDLRGQHVRDVLDLERDDPLIETLETAMAAQKPVSVQRYSDALGIWTLSSIYPSQTGLSVYFRDISDRKQRERQLEESRNRYQTLVEHFPNGAVALVDTELRYTTVGGTPISEAETTRGELEDRPVREVLPPEIADLIVPRYAAAIDGDESAFEATIGDHTYQFRIVPVRNDDGEVFGALGMSQDVTQRKEHEERLAALNDLNEISRDITSAVIEQSTRSEIEQTVCEHIARTDSYLLAWIGEVDPASKTVAIRAEAGIEGYLEGITISIDPNDHRSVGPTGRALRTGDVEVTHDIHADARHDPWREHLEAFGFRSSAAIPIKHEGTVYGVLNVYADRPSAFEDQERNVIGQLGEVIGHAIAAIERKQALLSDEVVELVFRARDIFSALEAPIETDGSITFDHVVPVEDDTFLVYGTATGDALATLDGLVEVLPHWSDVAVYAEGEPAKFELRLVEPPVLSAIAARGGYVEQATIEGGDYQMTTHLAPSTDVRQVIEAVTAAYPGAEMLRRRQITRPRQEVGQLHRRLADELTDRQRAALEAAYHGGYFEWPRDSTGEEVAASLGLASATFHQHLRKAQQKAFDALLADPIPSGR